jgi:aspartyl-tRNA(Asn)/glutamyl-tRNA(Gln) amidotransferase subunit A
MKSLIVDIHNKYISKDIEPKNLIYQYEKNTDTTNTFITRIDLKEQLNSLNSLKNNSLLYGIPYGMKDNISTKDIKTTGGSKFFEEYYPPFDATIYTLLNNAGAIMLGKTNLDEFGMAGTGV